MQHILLIDDDLDDREFFCDVLGEIDPHLTCDMASNGLEALSQLETSKNPDIIFLDLNMPHMNGFDFLQKFRSAAEYNRIPVIIYTTSNQLQDQEKAKELGAQGFLSKPPSLQVLGQKLRELLNVNFSGHGEFHLF